MLPDAKRLASIVHSALIVHFATDESLETWPPCLENHIVNFLHGAQLPQEYVATALALLAQLSFDNPYLYAENNDAECLFYAAMYTVAQRYADYKNYYPEAERFARFQFQFHDRRWSGRTWKAILNNIKDVLDFVWNQSQWMNLLDIDNLVSQSRPFARTRDEYVKAGKSEWIRARFFNEVIRGVMEGGNLANPDPRRKAIAGPLRMKPASIDCLLYCEYAPPPTSRRLLTTSPLHAGCFERGDKYPMPNDAPGGLPIYLGHRPWNGNDPYGSDYKHNTNGNLDIWTKGEKPETNPQVKFYHTVVVGPYQSFSLMSFRENGVPWNLNAEEKEMWKDWETHLRRIRLLPPSNEMEKKLAKAIKKERARLPHRLSPRLFLGLLFPLFGLPRPLRTGLGRHQGRHPGEYRLGAAITFNFP
jgi:hypothetical protein